jgi:NADPH-dependent 2,4-dienoyl-CoA reductase/sulfur reductase-like enzyme
MTRRRAIQLTGAALTLGLAHQAGLAQAGRPKRVIVTGGGIGGLSAAYELMKRGHVTVQEPSGRPGGHLLPGDCANKRSRTTNLLGLRNIVSHDDKP